MCRECVVTVRPERGRTCLETGAFVSNYAGCSACQQRIGIRTVGREVSEDEQDNGDYEETVTFHHACSACGHAIAEHYYTFSVVHPQHAPGSVQQEYLMECVLCGRAADTSHVLNDLTRPAHHGASVRAAPSIAAAAVSQQQQPAALRQLIGRIEIVSVAMHTTTAARSKSAEVEDDEWT